MSFILICSIIGLISFSLLAQEQTNVEMATQDSNQENGQEEESVVELNADQVNYDKENDQMIFVGNVIIVQEDTTLTAGQASFNVDTKIGKISENVKLVKEDISITGELLEAFLNDKRYIFENQVNLVQERQSDSGEQDNISWICQKLEIFTETKNMTATGEVKISKKDYTISAQEAVYNDIEDKITLTGQVIIEEIENDREISGDKAVFYIEDDKLEVTGNVRSRIVLD